MASSDIIIPDNYQTPVDGYESDESDIYLSAEEDEPAIQHTNVGTEYVAVENLGEWTKQFTDVEVNDFNSPTGPNHQLPLDATPLDYFKLFWSDGLIDDIVCETNR